MRNVTVTTKGNKLIIEIDVSDDAIAAGKMSTSGKSRTFASTGGACTIDLGGGKSIELNLSAYKK